jgi:hypothetical protein
MDGMPAALGPNAPHPHVDRRYLLVPCLRSSRIYIIDTKPDPVPINFDPSAALAETEEAARAILDELDRVS